MSGPHQRLRQKLWEVRREPLPRVLLRAKVLRPYRVRTFGSFGAGSFIDRPAWIAAPDKMAVGDGVMVMRGAWLAVEAPAKHRASDEPAIVLGDRSGLRVWCTISAAESVVLEEDVVVGAYCSIVDNDHTWSAGNQNVLHNPLAVSPVRVGAGTWIGDRCAILRGARIGRRCLIGANSVVRGEIPDFSIAVGAPARVVGTTR